MTCEDIDPQEFDWPEPDTKLAEADVIELRRLRTAGATYTDLGRRFGIAATHAYSVAVGRFWSHVPGAVTVAERPLRDERCPASEGSAT